MREAVFEDFVSFVKKQERACNHPVFGKLGVFRKETQSFPKAQAFETTAAPVEQQNPLEEEGAADVLWTSGNEKQKGHKNEMSEINAFKPPCLFCSGNHAAAKCIKARATMTREEKKEKLRDLCFACLKPGHPARACKFRLKCDLCGLMHPTVLHEARVNAESAAQADDQDTSKKETNLTTNLSSDVAVGTVMVKVWTTDRASAVTVKAIIDPGSTTTFATTNLLNQLGAEARPLALALSTIATTEEIATRAVYGLKIEGLDGNGEMNVGVAYEVAGLPNAGAVLSTEDLCRWPHLNDIWLTSVGNVEPAQMLLGQNLPRALKPTGLKDGSEGEPYAVRTDVGWALHGPVNKDTDRTPSAMSREVANFVRAQEIKQHLDRLMYHDFEQAFNFRDKGPSQEDRRWLEQVEASTCQGSDGHFTVGLPLRRDQVDRLVNNQQQALQRLRGLHRRFSANAQFAHDYCAFMRKMIEANHVERAPPVGSNVINYIPHHGVYHPRKPGKIRVVFNCANKFKGTALNDCLVAGPDLTNSILAVLLRFRQFQVAFMADLDAMFYQVLVPEQERDLLRFFWWEDPVAGCKPVEYRMKVHLFGAASSPSVANYALHRAAESAHRVDKASREVVQSIYKNFYVDDCLKSADSVEKATDLALGIKRACGHGGFNLSKFVATDIELLRALPPKDLAKDLSEVNLNDDKCDPLGSLQERALGVAWDVRNDCFVFRAKALTPTQSVTKRTILSQLSQVYDPIGLAAPVVITARMLFRQLTKDNRSWDETLSESETGRWNDWLQQLQNLTSVSTPRWMGLRAGDAAQLHAFCDASVEAYGAVVYLRTAGGGVHFVVGKARVTPPKVVTIPRLELTAAKLAADMINMVKAELEIEVENKTLWTDSQTVLKYLNNQQRRFHVFVANRVQAILNETTVQEWRFVPTQLNPADQASRGLKAEQLAASTWVLGPEFLR